ncbi:hypothetical protein LCI18_007228 [Fusarium solani-melongenae]|uniref:Uncharacterized protein n=1 Tax=Fusarium solani subsp. cucurbitae TaxID=2747967 RepID=A0ACD3Z4X6_FUSSC|nr:hypothetical protein LCI18_007228 [Fusarium solani-melongenae]
MASSITESDPSQHYAPWTILTPYENNTNDMRTLLAPPWVDSPTGRGTLDILQSCILTLFACIYTALHLDVPTQTAWHRVLLHKLEWVTITLFAPEIALYMAADQLQQAWSLKSKLLASGTNPTIDLRYAFFIVMGGVRVDVHEFISTKDLDDQYQHLFPPSEDNSCRRNVRLNAMGAVFLAKEGHVIPIPMEKIDDKSKADTIQKVLVLTQVLWFITQCIARIIYQLPLSLLEVHTMVHVVCTVVLYACWLKKPLDVKVPEIIVPDKFGGAICLLLQRQFYSKSCKELALFDPQAPLQTHNLNGDELTMHSIDPQSDMRMEPGDMLPSGLAYCGSKTFPFSEPFRHRWQAILEAFEFGSPDNLAKTAQRLDNRGNIEQQPQSPAQDIPQALYLARLELFKAFDTNAFRNMPFSEGKQNFDIPRHELKLHLDNFTKDTNPSGINFAVLSMLAAALSASYGGVHLCAWDWAFPTRAESTLWKISCIYVASSLFMMLALLALFIIIHLRFKSEPLRKRLESAFSRILWPVLIAYAASRAFIVVEAFLSLRQVPVGVYVTPAWVQMFPHF